MSSRRAWSWLGLAVVVIALVLDVVHRPQHIGIDFHTYLAAAMVGLQQGWSHVYDQGLVAAAQKHLVPGQYAQPFLSPPTVAWLAAPLTVFSYWTAFGIWAVLSFIALSAALAWSGVSTGIARWIAVVGALAPWWVLHAINLGQVVPLVAAGVVVAWRLMRQDKDIAAGVLLSVIFLKPNTAILVPVVLLVAGRYRVFAAWVAAGAALALIVGIVLATAFRLRSSPGLVMPIGIVGSLIVSPYLHASDLCLLAAAAWMVWEERTTVTWRIALALGWLVASPFLFLPSGAPGLNRWPLIESALLLALVVVAWWPFTSAADLRTRAPA